VPSLSIDVTLLCDIPAISAIPVVPVKAVITGNVAFELYTKTRDIMDTHVARIKWDKTDYLHELHDDIPKMSQADGRIYSKYEEDFWSSRLRQYLQDRSKVC
jgi:predicted PilT family ATPase